MGLGRCYRSKCPNKENAAESIFTIHMVSDFLGKKKPISGIIL